MEAQRTLCCSLFNVLSLGMHNEKFFVRAIIPLLSNSLTYIHRHEIVGQLKLQLRQQDLTSLVFNEECY